jgi:CheY-like chemotaxis protein
MSLAAYRLFFLRPISRFGEDMSAGRILVVDDSDDVRSFLVLLLERSGGYETLEAATGEEAVEKAISRRPDLILMDIRLPGISGVDATEANKKQSKRGPDSNYRFLCFAFSRMETASAKGGDGSVPSEAGYA